MNTKRILKYFLFIVAFGGPLQLALNTGADPGIWNVLWLVVALAIITYAASIAVNKN